MYEEDAREMLMDRLRNAYSEGSGGYSGGSKWTNCIKKVRKRYPSKTLNLGQISKYYNKKNQKCSVPGRRKMTKKTERKKKKLSTWNLCVREFRKDPKLKHKTMGELAEIYQPFANKLTNDTYCSVGYDNKPRRPLGKYYPCPKTGKTRCLQLDDEKSGPYEPYDYGSGLGNMEDEEVDDLGDYYGSGAVRHCKRGQMKKIKGVTRCRQFVKTRKPTRKPTRKRKTTRGRKRKGSGLLVEDYGGVLVDYY